MLRAAKVYTSGTVDLKQHIFTIIMNQLTLTTPALLFSAISLLLLAYTNRFLAYANVVRSLHARFKENRSKAELGGANGVVLISTFKK